ncbi:hypothetical protein MJO28_003201 [Puccinia striiformis f. sp. tritici]|uniref:Uncharacterized protein n=1 Tax=Puccinia striiformis f. sp. tritici TaxID=168172 RepID=A0ACC0ES19_9BASI|nr:hypothetical protein MJO28_003201 [Puccinia striiformis f. sp. tritici]
MPMFLVQKWQLATCSSFAPSMKSTSYVSILVPLCTRPCLSAETCAVPWAYITGAKCTLTPVGSWQNKRRRRNKFQVALISLVCHRDSTSSHSRLLTLSKYCLR